MALVKTPFIINSSESSIEVRCTGNNTMNTKQNSFNVNGGGINRTINLSQRYKVPRYRQEQDSGLFDVIFDLNLPTPSEIIYNVDTSSFTSNTAKVITHFYKTKDDINISIVDVPGIIYKDDIICRGDISDVIMSGETYTKLDCVFYKNISYHKDVVFFFDINVKIGEDIFNTGFYFKHK